MTDLSRLKVSLTKHGAHKAFLLLRDLEPDDVVKSVWNVHNGIKIERAQTKQNLSAFADERLPGFWRQAKDHSEDTLRRLVFLAIVFSHHRVIEAFQNGAVDEGRGEIRRDVVLKSKAFTNTKNNIVELGLSTRFDETAVSYDLRSLFQDGTLGRLAHQLFNLKLQYAGWGGQGSVVDEAVNQGFHKALSLSEGAFREWLLGGVTAHAVMVEDEEEPAEATADPDTVDKREFVFVKGHNPGKEGRTRRSLPKEPAQANLIHNMLQNKLYEYLCGVHGAINVGTEVPQGVGGNLIDVVTEVDGEITFYELKTRPSIRLCIREALPQLLEYSFWPDDDRSNRLIIVSEAAITTDASNYLKKLRERFQLPMYYSQIDRTTGQLGDLN